MRTSAISTRHVEEVNVDAIVGDATVLLQQLGDGERHRGVVLLVDLANRVHAADCARVGGAAEAHAVVVVRNTDSHLQS